MLERGWAILRSMEKLGLILAPEVVEWNTPVSLGTPSPIRVLQRRVCFTELSPGELGEHSQRFGPFALEFDTTALRRMGALPVIYMPQALSEDDHLALLGPFVVGHLDQIRGTLERLNELDRIDHADFLRSNNADRVAEDCMVTLKNVDESESPVQEFQVPWKIIKDLLSYIGFETAPFNAMTGAISIAQAMLYPTDDDHSDRMLGYYRQREWRITADYLVNSSPRGRHLLEEEKKILYEVDRLFWEGSTHVSTPNPLINQALVLVQPTPEDFLDATTRIIVPDSLVRRARWVFGDRVAGSSQISYSE